MLIEAPALAAFALIAFGLVITPGPNMMYLVSRSITQGRRAGIVSLAGIATGFVFYLVATALGLTAIAMAVPLAYDAVRFAGVVYLLWLAWNAIKPGGHSPFAPVPLPPHGPLKLYSMGLATALLNPKVAILYMSLLPQFISPAKGQIFEQYLLLGVVQIAVSVSVNLLIVLFAGSLAKWLQSKPVWMTVQRWLMATVLGGMAAKLAFERR